MSRSTFRISLEFAMLDGRKKCVPGFEDSTGGHIIFKSGACKMKLVGPGSNVFDGISWDESGNVVDQPYDREEWVNYMVEKFREEVNRDGVLRYLFGSVFDQAKAHCDEHHNDYRERFKGSTREKATDDQGGECDSSSRSAPAERDVLRWDKRDC